jgi:cytoskeletal protein CcmA (bactofilin family)
MKRLVRWMMPKKSTILSVERPGYESITAKPAEPHKPGAGDSHIADDAEFQGLMVHRGQKLVISGECNGEFRQTRRGASLFVNDSATLNGVLVTTNLAMDGKFTGSIEAQSVSVGRNGKVHGEVEYETFACEGELNEVVFKHTEYFRSRTHKGDSLRI